MNSILKLFFVIIFSGNVCGAASSTSSSEPEKNCNIWQAIELYEARRDDEARAIFANFPHSPVARPYCKALRIKMPVSLIPEHKDYEFHESYFKISRILRMQNMEEKQKYKKFLELVQSGVPASFVMENYDRALTLGDFRAAFKVDKTKMFNGMAAGIISAFLSRSNNIPQCLFDLGRFAALKSETKKLSEECYIRAASFGHFEAQKKMAELYPNTPDKRLFWAMHVAEQNDPEALVYLGDYFHRKKDPKAFDLFQRAVLFFDDVLSQKYPIIYKILALYCQDRREYEQGEAYCRKAVEFGYVEAKPLLLELIMNQDRKDDDLLKELAQSGNIEAQLFLIESEIRNEEENQDELIVTLDEILTRSDLSQKQLGRINRLHYNVSRDFSRLIEAEKYGDVEALYDIGKAYELGERGTHKDTDKAIYYFNLCLDHNFKIAHLPLGAIFMNRHQDERAVYHLNQASQLNLSTEQRAVCSYNLALMYIQNRGGASFQPLELEQLLNTAISFGDEDAQAMLAIIYREGLLGVEKNADKAIELFEELSDAVKAEGLCRIYDGVMNRDEALESYDLDSNGMISRPVRTNCDLALKLMQEASDLGCQKSKFNMAMIYWSVKKNLKIARRIFHYMEPGRLKQLAFQLLPEETPVDLRAVAPVVSSSSFSPESSSSSSSSSSAPIVAETEVEVEMSRLDRKIEKLRGKKQIKWRKMQKIMGMIMKAEGGHVKTGKGSGRRLKVGEASTGLHIPHGRDASELTGGRLASLMELLN